MIMQLWKIKVTFHYLDKDSMKKIMTKMIIPKVEYEEAVWIPQKKHEEIGMDTQNSH